MDTNPPIKKNKIYEYKCAHTIKNLIKITSSLKTKVATQFSGQICIPGYERAGVDKDCAPRQDDWYAYASSSAAKTALP